MKNKLTSICTSPITQESLKQNNNYFIDDMGNRFPIIDNKPILLDNKRSIFKTHDFEKKEVETIETKKSFNASIIDLMSKLKPSITTNISSKDNYYRLAEDMSLLTDPLILIVGAGEKDGDGLEIKSISENITFIKTDVFLADYIDVVCDAHNLPFKNSIFDAVIIQAVLEHVTDPYRCVDEIHRVLKDSGFVYSETPFMQQVHLGRYDFTRFTHLGHRRLFRNFEEVKSGVSCGPASALTWGIKYFIRSFFKPSAVQFFVEWIFTFLYFWIKYFDYFLVKKQGSFDAASGYYFYGKKSNNTLTDDDLINLYRGMLQ